ncbi:MAG: TetR/AcrR family transcriptional regulator [Acidimicrobiales bacterium]
MAKRAQREPTSLREVRRRQHDGLSREHILDAAEHVFSRKGFHEATLKEIAEQAEFSVGALYGFFEGKDDLFAQVMERHGTAFVALVQEAVDSNATAAEKLHALVQTHFAYFGTHHDFYHLLQRTIGVAFWNLKANLDEASFERYRKAINLEAKIFKQGVEGGEFRDEDPETLANLFSGLMQAYLAHWIFNMDENGHSPVDERYPMKALHDLIDRAFLR